MKIDEINSSLIKKAKAALPLGMNLAGMLMDILCLGKEAVYRRLRGEVAFSLAEAVTISRKMGISLDRLAGGLISPDSLFLINNAECEEYVDIYCDSLDSYSNSFMNLKGDNNSRVEVATVTIPQAFYHKYPGISKLRFFRWMYQHDYDRVGRNFEDMEIPARAVEKGRNYVRASKNLASASYIFEENLFRHPVNDVKYFSSINLLSEESTRQIKEEFMSLIDDMETIGAAGRYDNGNQVLLYLARINFEMSYSLIEADNYNICAMGIYGINHLISKDPEAMDRIRKWIYSLKKFSTLISQSGEVHRIQFFDKQREIVNTL